MRQVTVTCHTHGDSFEGGGGGGGVGRIGWGEGGGVSKRRRGERPKVVSYPRVGSFVAFDLTTSRCLDILMKHASSCLVYCINNSNMIEEFWY